VKAAIDQRIISDVSLIPSTKEVKNHKRRSHFIRETRGKEGSGRGPGFHPQALRDGHARRVPGLSLSQGNPLHASTIIIVPAREDRVTRAQARRNGWIRMSSLACTPSCNREDSFRLLQAYPWTRNSGKVARLLTNYIPLRNG